jgi:hypothetical protein
MGNHLSHGAVFRKGVMSDRATATVGRLSRITGTTVFLLLAGSGLTGCSGRAATQATASRPDQSSPQIAKDETSLSITWSDPTRAAAPVLRYRYANVPGKPYVAEFRSPAGLNVLRETVADHPHHHGLMFAVRVDDVDTWPEGKGAGVQLHRDFAGIETDRINGCGVAWFKEQLDWLVGGTDNVKLQEERTIFSYDAARCEASLLTWESRLVSPPGQGPLTLKGADYYGLGLRFVPSMDVSGEFVNADGARGVEGTNAACSNWCAYSAKVDGQPVTVAVFAHPGNPRHPSTWFTMTKGFAYLSATLNLKKEPLTLSPGETLALRYGVAVWDGTPEPSRMDAVYRRWLELTATDVD